MSYLFCYSLTPWTLLDLIDEALGIEDTSSFADFLGIVELGKASKPKIAVSIWPMKMHDFPSIFVKSYYQQHITMELDVPHLQHI